MELRGTSGVTHKSWPIPAEKAQQGFALAHSEVWAEPVPLRAGSVIAGPVALHQQCAFTPEVVEIKVKTAELFKQKEL